MNHDRFDHILPLVEKPSRYLGTEINTVRKDPRSVRLRIALAFPDLYEIGTSHFGLQILYHLLNRQAEIAAERVFAPSGDMEARLRASGSPLFSLETHTPLDRFDIIGFSLLYELNYTNVLTMLELAAIPWLAADRGEAHPLIIAGGPCTCNPEPVADFFDALVIGDGEAVVPELAGSWLEWRESGRGDRQGLLKRWAGIEGVYVPAFFEARYDSNGFQTLAPRLQADAKVRRAIVADLNEAAFPDAPVVPFGKPVHDRLRLEVARGCSRGCRFCQAGMLYRPVRERSVDRLFDLATRSLAATGYEDLSLLSLSTGDYGCIVPLMERLMRRFAGERVAVSLPSLRAGTLSPELLDLIKQVRKTGFTIAPEAGSQRLRDVINKNITAEDILATVSDAFQAGWRLIKLYFMIGLPTETEEDLKSLVDLVYRLRRLKGAAGRRGQINVSVATFIPKPHTPFQWAAQVPLVEAREKLRRLQDELRRSGIEFKWQNPEMSLLEGVWARGDRRLGRALQAAHRRGCRFDGWGDRLDIDTWMDAFEETGIDPAFFTTRSRDVHEPLPWDHIDIRVSREFLASEWRKALAGSTTDDCRQGECSSCGVCDFERVSPRLQSGIPGGRTEKAAARPAPGIFRKLQVSYSKLGPARFLGHLETVNIFLRALRRAGIQLKFSEGFHPKPKVAFDNPLPSGVESEEERLVVTAAQEVTPHRLLVGLNAQLPQGLHVHACSETIQPPPAWCTYRVTLAGAVPAENLRFAAGEGFDGELVVTSAKGALKKFAVKDILKRIDVADAMSLEMTLCCEPGSTVRPSEILKQVLRVPEGDIKLARILKLSKRAADA